MRIIKSFLIGLMLSMLPSVSFAQSSVKNQKDYILLKDGTEYIGVIIEEVNGKSFTIKTIYDDVICIDESDINEKGKKLFYAYNHPTGVYFEPSITVFDMINNEGYSGICTEVDFSLGKKFSPQKQVAVGIGAMLNSPLDTWGWIGCSIPVYIEYKNDILPKTKVSPYFEARVGGIIPLKAEARGLLLRTGGGISYNIGSKRMSVGIIFQSFGEKYDYSNWLDDEPEFTNNPFSLSCGITMKFTL